MIAVRTYKTRPKYDDLTGNDGKVHEYTAYWWPNSYPSQGDRPFTDSDASWKPSADITGDDALFEECIESATFDPQAEIEGLKESSRSIRRKLSE